MRYLKKFAQSITLFDELTYPKNAEKIRERLLHEQMGFCAYSERYIGKIDACDVEHFDPRLKGTEHDTYWNWYTVLHWMNQHKSRNIEAFEPILQPYADDLRQRIKYEDGQFLVIDSNDQAASNLINFLGWNRPELCNDRRKHINRIRSVQKLCGNQEDFFDHLVNDPDNLSFFSALCAEFDLPDGLLLEAIKRNE